MYTDSNSNQGLTPLAIYFRPSGAGTPIGRRKSLCSVCLARESAYLLLPKSYQANNLSNERKSCLDFGWHGVSYLDALFPWPCKLTAFAKTTRPAPGR